MFVCRRLFHSTRAAFLPLGPKAMVPEVGRKGGREGGRERRRVMPGKSMARRETRSFSSIFPHFLPSTPPPAPSFPRHVARVP